MSVRVVLCSLLDSFHQHTDQLPIFSSRTGNRNQWELGFFHTESPRDSETSDGCATDSGKYGLCTTHPARLADQTGVNLDHSPVQIGLPFGCAECGDIWGDLVV